MMASDLHHRTEDFKNVYKSTLTDLKEVLATSNDVLMFAASGTGGLDASVSNLFRRGDKVIVCCAGKFGERFVEIVQAYGLEPSVLSVPYGGAVSTDAVRAALAAEPAMRGVFVQASETSTGAAHDIKGMAEAVRATQAILVVDGITGIGTMPLDIDGWGIDVLVGGSQKSFMIPPGLAFMTVSPKAWKHGETSNLPHYYFDLKKEKKSADKFEANWTPPTALILALGEALRYVKSVGMAQLIENAQMLARATRNAITAVGLELFVPDHPGAAVTAVKAPAGMDSGVIIKEFRNRFGAIITNGQGSMKGQIFRIAHLGYYDFWDLFALIAGLEMILHAKGLPVEFGKGVAEVEKVYAGAAIR